MSINEMVGGLTIKPQQRFFFVLVVFMESNNKIDFQLVNVERQMKFWN
jgi:hypothetical protein